MYATMTSHLDDLLAELRSKGHRITLPRRWTLKVLTRSNGHMTSEDVYHRLAESGIQVDEATVYRTLQWLADHRIVARTNLGLGADVYSLYSQPHHHLICLNCREIRELDDTLFVELRSRIQEQYHFTPQMDHFAIFGTCEDCQSRPGT
jgi:Fur family ferric uptake transcriptional regulator